MILRSSSEMDWQKMAGIVPVIIQDEHTAAVLMLGYMNQAALDATLQSNRVTFFSRSKQRLWQKGETSGNYLEVVDIYLDCDQDALLIIAKPQGPTCHLGELSCFSPRILPWQFLQTLHTLLQQRQSHPQADSYTSQLFAAGIPRIAQKIGEEGVEVALAAVTETPETLLEEAADLLFHLLVLLTAKRLNVTEVVAILQQRHK